ncbi:hypothetical protein K7X08_018205 [Anisodus acutangulus]|uniref:EF-hand domain-containing protein n=1 Tax=Anisodus acutangulus TaxID=402998 RepID=A0A9Q1LVL0_9SOLA|nr:hypothetical protein K7X08_018205 [Anisodus acutangulus]
MGLQDFSEEELKNMIKEGDMDGDEALDQIKFCILMFRLSPDLLDVAQELLHKAEQLNLIHYKLSLYFLRFLILGVIPQRF